MIPTIWGHLKVLSAKNVCFPSTLSFRLMYIRKNLPQKMLRKSPLNMTCLWTRTDNLYARYLINDVCVLQQKPYIFGSVYQFEGQTSVFKASEGPCYRCISANLPLLKRCPKVCSWVFLERCLAQLALSRWLKPLNKSPVSAHHWQAVCSCMMPLIWISTRFACRKTPNARSAVRTQRSSQLTQPTRITAHLYAKRIPCLT